MFRTIDDFAKSWQYETESTLKTLNAITDASLAQPVGDEYRTLGRIAWHTTDTVKEMMERTGLHVEGAPPNAPVPAKAKEIAETYQRSAASLMNAIRANWNDETLEIVDEMYGMKWARGATLHVLITHQAHHRGQMTVLMRQAGIAPPGIYGPTKEEWAQWQMEPPVI
jgi:uncharacterized damage-inducible protein DinB